MFDAAAFDLRPRKHLFLAVDEKLIVLDLSHGAVCTGVDAELIEADASGADRRARKTIVAACHGRHRPIAVRQVGVSFVPRFVQALACGADSGVISGDFGGRIVCLPGSIMRLGHFFLREENGGGPSSTGA